MNNFSLAGDTLDILHIIFPKNEEQKIHFLKTSDVKYIYINEFDKHVFDTVKVIVNLLEELLFI